VATLHYSTVRIAVFVRRESREAVSKNPYGYLRELGTGRCVVRHRGRMTGFLFEKPVEGQSNRSDGSGFWVCAIESCGGPIGVVKFLRARGGCLGVIRIRAWKAAICPGELPNER
jgi:hypothetical protein